MEDASTILKIIIFLLSAIVFTIEYIVFVKIGGASPYAAFGMALAVTFVFNAIAKKAFRFRREFR